MSPLIICDILSCFVLSVMVMMTVGKAVNALMPVKIIFSLIACAVDVALMFYFQSFTIPLPLIFIGMMLVILAQTMLIFPVNLHIVMWCSLALTFHIVCLRGIVTTIYCFITSFSIYEVINTPDKSATCQLISTAIMSALLMVLFVVQARDYFATILHARSQFYLVTAVESVMIAYSLLLSFAYYIDISIHWFTSFILISMLALQLAHSLLLRRAMRISTWLEEDLKQSVLSNQLERQLTHYKAYQRHIEAFDEFRREYYTVTGELRHKLQLHDKDGALQLLETTDTQIDKLSGTHIKYSNSMLADAILEDYHAQCIEKGIEYDAKIFIPDELKLSDLQLCRLFGNVFSNALDSCIKLPEGRRRYISFSDTYQDGWLTIEQTNAMNGGLRYNGDLLLTDKHNTVYHGMGLGIIQDIAEGIGGFIELGAREDDKEFYLRIHLPV